MLGGSFISEKEVIELIQEICSSGVAQNHGTLKEKPFHYGVFNQKGTNSLFSNASSLNLVDFSQRNLELSMEGLSVPDVR